MPKPTKTGKQNSYMQHKHRSQKTEVMFNQFCIMDKEDVWAHGGEESRNESICGQNPPNASEWR